MFEGFTRARIPTRLGELNVVHGGEGPPLVLFHGYLQTHVAWRMVAPHLARCYHVIAADLPGHGDSDKPPPGPNHVNYAKRTMGEAVIDMMAELGYDRFRLAGHDRGGRVSYRLALDHPEKVHKLCLLDMTPNLETFERVEQDFHTAFRMWHWFFLAQPAPLPESMLERCPEEYVRHKLDLNLQVKEAISPEAMDEYVRCFSNPATIHATCNDYRATATIDCEIDDVSRKRGDRIRLPTMVIMGNGRSDAFDLWRKWIEDPRCIDAHCGHYVPEEAADLVTRSLLDFLAD